MTSWLVWISKCTNFTQIMNWTNVWCLWTKSNLRFWRNKSLLQLLIKFVKMKEFVVIVRHEPLNFFKHLQFVHCWQIIVWLSLQHLLNNLLFVFENISCQIRVFLKLTVKITKNGLRAHLESSCSISLFENYFDYFLQESFPLLIWLFKLMQDRVLGCKNQEKTLYKTMMEHFWVILRY